MSSRSLQKDPSSWLLSIPPGASPGLSYLNTLCKHRTVTQASSLSRWREVSSHRLHMVCRSLTGAERRAWVGAAALRVLQAAAAAAAAEQRGRHERRGARPGLGPFPGRLPLRALLRAVRHRRGQRAGARRAGGFVPMARSRSSWQEPGCRKYNFR